MQASPSRLGPWAALALAALPTLAAGQPVGEEFQVNTETAFAQQTSSDRAVAADANGNFVVVWGSGGQDGSMAGVFGQRYDSQGSPRGGEFQINSYTTGDQTAPSVASDPAGNFVVVWQGYGMGAPYQAIFGRRFDSEGQALGSEFRVNTTFPGGAGSLEHPSVASDAAGNFVVVWDCDRHQPYGQCATFGQRFDADGLPLGGEFQIGSTSSGNPSVSSDASGHFVVAYPQGLGVYGRRYDADGVPRGNAFRIDSFAGRLPSVSSDAEGNFVVTWHAFFDQDGDEFGVFGRRYDSAGVPQGSEFQVNSYTTDWQEESSVASDASGNFVVVWQSNEQDGSDFGIFGQRFDSEGAALGAEFQINSWTSSAQRLPSVAITGPGRFVVVWYSYYQDGSGRGVFGQRFDFGADTITVVSPNSDVRWRIGALERIQWTHNLGAEATFRIELDRDDDGEYEELIAAEAPVDAAGKGLFAWIVSGPPAAAARVRVSWTDDRDVFDASDGTFQIRQVGAAAVVVPREAARLHRRPEQGASALSVDASDVSLTAPATLP